MSKILNFYHENAFLKMVYFQIMIQQRGKYLAHHQKAFSTKRKEKMAFDNRVVKHPIFKSLVSWCCVLTPIHITLRTSVVSSLRRGLLLLLIAGYSLMNNEWTRVSSSVLLENEAALASRKTDNTYLFGGREFGYLTDEQLFFQTPTIFGWAQPSVFFLQGIECHLIKLKWHLVGRVYEQKKPHFDPLLRVWNEW